MSGRTYWVTGIPGTHVRGALNRIREAFPTPLEIVSVDSLLADVYLEVTGNTAERARLEEPGGFQLILGQAPPEVAALWPRAADRALEAVQALRKKADVVLTFHAVYHADKYGDLYSPVAPDRLAEFPAPDRVVNLIDDIGDVACRLRQHKQMFAYRPHMGLASVQSALRDLLTLLEWRLSEFTVTRLLAASRKVSAFQLAVKHPVASAVKYLQGSGRPLYVSHSISESRRRWAPKAGWPPFVEEVQRFTRRLATDETIIPIAPTTIDEWRISSQKVNGEDCLVPRLLGRWNYLSDEPLVDPVAEGAAENWLDPADYFGGRLDESPLSDKTTSELQRLNGLLSALSSRIQTQVNARDHTLVQQCPLVAVFRPYFAWRVSGGVAAEIRHRDRLAGDREVCFVHAEDDFRLRDIGRISEGVRLFQWRRHSKPIEYDDVAKIVRSGLDDGGPADGSAEAISARVEEVLSESKIELEGPFGLNGENAPLANMTTVDVEKRIGQIWENIAETVTQPDEWKPLADHWIVANGSPEEQAVLVSQAMAD